MKNSMKKLLLILLFPVLSTAQIKTSKQDSLRIDSILKDYDNEYYKDIVTGRKWNYTEKGATEQIENLKRELKDVWKCILLLNEATALLQKENNILKSQLKSKK